MMSTLKTKQLFTLLLALCSFISNGQWYGSQTYVGLPFSHGGRLFTTSLTNNNWGYVIAGSRPVTTAGNPNFDVQLLDADGQFGPGSFHNTYRIFNDNTCAGLNPVLDCAGVTVIGAVNTGGGEVFAMTGAFNEGVFFATLDANGVPVNTFRWFFPLIANAPISKPFISHSTSNPNDFFICGEWSGHVYVIRVDGSSATPIWANFYNLPSNDMTPRALLESPFNINDLFVVGRRGTQSSSEAFIMQLNAINGGFVNVDLLTSGVGDANWLTSIKPAISPIGGNGFILGGYSVASSLGNGFTPPWMLRLDQTGAVVWSTIIEPIYANSQAAQSVYEINDVLERFNPNTGFFEYYGVGGSSLNGTDYLSVFKLHEDGTLGALSPTEFRFFDAGTAGVDASCYISDITNGTDAGLQMYSLNFPTGRRALVKSYYNGVSGCNDSVSNIANLLPGPTIRSSSIAAVGGIFSGCQANFQLTTQNVAPNVNTICFSPTVPGGSNARLLNTNGISDDVIKSSSLEIYPNPVQSGAVLHLNSEQQEVQRLVISNILGERILDQIVLNKSSNDFIVKIPNHLNSGTYIVTIFTNTDIINKKLVIVE